MEELVLQVREDEPGSRSSVIQVEAAGPRRCGRKRRDAGEGCDVYCQTNEQKIVNVDAVWLQLWNKRLLNPALAPAEALRRVEVSDDAGSSTAGGSRN